MRITEILLKSANLDKMSSFYADLGLQIDKSVSDQISFQVGWTKIRFKLSDNHVPYHYCFLIPSNKLEQALIWMQNFTSIITNEENSEITYFENWNAHSIYFWDPDGNIVELITRHDLDYTSHDTFNASEILGLNEIGLPTYNITGTQEFLSKSMGTTSWLGNDKVFGTHGDLEGLLLLPNPEFKKTWYPTQTPIEIAKVEFKVEANGRLHRFSYPFN